jgi:hypothetical protein
VPDGFAVGLFKRNNITMPTHDTQAPTAGKMSLLGLIKNIAPFVKPYRWLIVLTLVLTVVSSLTAQVNAVVLDRAVDAINSLLHTEGGFQWSKAARLLLIVS